MLNINYANDNLKLCISLKYLPTDEYLKISCRSYDAALFEEIMTFCELPHRKDKRKSSNWSEDRPL